MTSSPTRLRCVRCHQTRSSHFYAQGEGPRSRAGRAWTCAWCAPRLERKRAKRDDGAQPELPFPKRERMPGAEIFD